jgi:hypothetical protein
MGDVVLFRRPSLSAAPRRPTLSPENPYWLADALHLRSYDRAIVHAATPRAPPRPDDES